MKVSKRFICLLSIIGFLGILIFPLATPSRAACFNATSLGAIGNTTLSAACTVAADTSEVNDYTTSEDSTNAAVTTITAAVTVNSGSVGTTVLGSGSFSIGVNGSIAVGSTRVTIKPSYPVWVADADVDEWALNWTFNTATAAARTRLGLLKSASTLDCNDAAYSTTNTCYPAFYPAFGPYGGFGPYGSFYPQFSP